MNRKQELDNTVAELREQRDELNLQIYLASSEIHDEWAELEDKWQDFLAKSKQLQKEQDTRVDAVYAALLALNAEIKTGYTKIREAL